jgi:hypothetical protein
MGHFHLDGSESSKVAVMTAQDGIVYPVCRERLENTAELTLGS